MAHDVNPHRPTRRRRSLTVRIGRVLAAGAAATAIIAATASGSARHTTTAAVTVPVSGATVGPPVPAGFVGLATEYWNVEGEVGTDPNQPDIAFEQALRSLAPQGGFSLRIGGDSTDWAWFPIPGMKQPPWVRWTMTPTWAAVTSRLVSDLHAHLIAGINMEASNIQIDKAEIHEIQATMGSAPITYELGNEPELYSHFPFYHHAGQVVLGRPTSFSLTDMTAQWNQMANALPHVRLAGPGYAGLDALPYLNQFLTASHRLSLVTVHTYPLKSTRCAALPHESGLFTPASLQGLANGVARWAALAHQHGVGIRVDEMNSVTCGGQPGLTNTFGPALWALNELPLYAETGINGVNFQSRPYTAQNLIQTTLIHRVWHVQVQPEYYGLLAFAQLTPPGSRLLRVGTLPSGLYAWAVITSQGVKHVVVTNVGTQPVAVDIPAAGAHGPATVQTLSAGAGGLLATGGVTLGGQRVSQITGALIGRRISRSVPATAGAFPITVAPASAAILTFQG
jgi:hypothetical protein